MSELRSKENPMPARRRPQTQGGRRVPQEAASALLPASGRLEWRDDGTSSVKSERFAELLAALRIVAASFRAAVKSCCEEGEGERPCASSPAPAAPASAASLRLLLEPLRLYGRGLDLGKTLLTICRAHQTLTSSETVSQRARSEVNGLLQGLAADAAPLRARLLAVDERSAALKAHRELALWRRRLAPATLSQALDEPLKSFAARMQADVVAPAASVYTHLSSTMSITVCGLDRRPRVQGFGASLAVLKNADDPMLRRTTYEGLNAWLAEHAAIFLDLQNAIAGARIMTADRMKEDLFAAALKFERTSLSAYNAMFDALDARLPEIRQAVTLRQNAFGGGRMAVWNLLSPPPAAFYSGGRTLAQSIDDIDAAAAAVDPHFCAFLREALAKGCIDARSISLRAGTGWCDDLPALGMVKICLPYQPTMGGLASLVHLFGAGYLMRIMHGAPQPARQLPLSAVEIAGTFAETALFADLRQRHAKRAGEEAERFSEILLWQSLRRIANCLLLIPARHWLLKSILRERANGLLSFEMIDRLSIDAWRHFFVDVLDGEDRYVWAYKPHFYRTSPLFYDWQYTMGFLLSHALLAQIKERGATACGAPIGEAWIDLGELDVNAFAEKHLGEDLGSRAFWDKAISKAIEPIREAAARPGIFMPKPKGGRQ